MLVLVIYQKKIKLRNKFSLKIIIYLILSIPYSVKGDSISKLEQLKVNLKDMGSVAIGFSGGADSSFLLKVASDVLGDNVFAITVNSMLHPKRELSDAVRFVQQMNAHHIVIDVDMDAIEDFKENPENRCYFCKKFIFSKIKDVAKQENIPYVLDASNYDDLQDYRPGMKALERVGVISPLVDVGLGKSEIRELSKQMDLDTWNKPSFACLASRFPYGVEITKSRLEQVEKAELFLHSLGIKQFRVRYHTEVARIEVSKNDFQRIFKHSDEIVKKFKELGFNYIALDIEGYRTGSLNEVLKQ
jgi:uncharacterized protein